MEGQVFMQEDKLKGFRKYGFIMNTDSASQAIGDCIFCGKPNKLYINKINQLWDCKVCMKKGNYLQFLEEIHKISITQIVKADLLRLSLNRGLPVEAFSNYKIGRFGNDYVLPIFNSEGKLQDLRTYKFGNKLMSSMGCQVSLLGIEKLNSAPKGSKVYLCEGEWDAMAFAWLLKNLKLPGYVVGTPGAGTFKMDWVPAFREKNVIVMYDNDGAGENGDGVVYGRLRGAVDSLKFLHWLPSFPVGFDVRDLVVEQAIKDKKPKGTFALVTKLLKDFPRKGSVPIEEIETAENPTKLDIKDRTMTLEKVFKVFEKWMHTPNRDAIELSIATIISNELQGDPLWLFLVAPPGGSKTEILSSFDKCTNTYITSSLTPHALISGTSFKSGKDPSLIPKLDGKTLIVKDFTSILGKRETEKDEIFGILRDAYDGKCGKVFGTGTTRYYKSHFSVLSGVTPTIYELSSQYAGLGERFLKFFIGDSLVHLSEKDIIRRAMKNVNRETNMREEMAEAVRDYVSLILEEMRKPGYKPPSLPEEMENRIIGCAQFVARLRASVPRDKFNSEMILSKPSAEVGSRLGKQLTRVALGIAIVNRSKQVTDHSLRILKKVALDTVSQRNESILRAVYKACNNPDDSIRTKEIAFDVRYPFSTVSRVLNDMDVLDIVKRIGNSGKAEWRVSDYIQEIIKESTMYTLSEEINRTSYSNGNGRLKLKIKRRIP